MGSILEDDQPIRYIKLGDGGKWAGDCIRDGYLRLGFWGDREILDAAILGRWEDVRLIIEGRTKAPADALRQIRDFLEDDGRTTWITFHKRLMYWTKTLPGAVAELYVDERNPGFRRSLIRGGWSSCDAKGEELRLDDLAGHLGMVSQYRGTICTPQRPEYVHRRLAGKASAVAERTAKLLPKMYAALQEMMGELTPGDFELLVDMTFTAAGWRRVGRSGGTEEDIDLLLVRAAHGPTAREGELERIAVQIKLETSQSEFEQYRTLLVGDGDKVGTYRHAYYVYVRAKDGGVIRSSDNRITLFDAARLAPMVLNAGLTDWLHRRVR